MEFPDPKVKERIDRNLTSVPDVGCTRDPESPLEPTPSAAGSGSNERL